jgi:hypothetical protein
MRIIAPVAAGLCITVHLHAQQPIEWSPQRKLTKADFQGRMPTQTVNASKSALHIEASWECVIGELNASARALFDPSLSWWRTGYGNIWGNAGERTSATAAQANARRNVMALDAQLLDHEQLHFDLAELAARRIRKRFEEFKDICHDPTGTEPIKVMVAEADREFQEEQVRYDRETAHGADVRIQDAWTRRVRALLK